MKKSELGVGIFVKLRNNKICLIDYDEDLIDILDGRRYGDLFDYDEDLKNEYFYEDDIVEVYLNILPKPIWVREEE